MPRDFRIRLWHYTFSILDNNKIRFVYCYYYVYLFVCFWKVLDRPMHRNITILWPLLRFACTSHIRRTYIMLLDYTFSTVQSGHDRQPAETSFNCSVSLQYIVSRDGLIGNTASSPDLTIFSVACFMPYLNTRFLSPSPREMWR